MTLKSNPFPSVYEEFIFKSRYAKWIESENRRESWDETVNRLVAYYSNQCGLSGDDWASVRDELFHAIHSLEVMPSMRALMTAGPALDRNNLCSYNCAYVTVNDPKVFDEVLYVLMCGTGVGYSVEEKYVQRLPEIASSFEESPVVLYVGDSKEGWAKSFRELISLLYDGKIPQWDVSRVRPAGARLRTFGGRASGPGPLVDLFNFTVRIFQGAAGRRLNSLECHDILCKVGDVVVVGGVRRSAMISLSDVNDDRLRSAKTGFWWKDFSYRALANNSAVYDKDVDTGVFLREWTALYESRAGERGFFSRYACKKIAERNSRRDSSHEFGTNPCSEIILRPFQLCNLTEVIVRANDTPYTLREKVRKATILGTIQSSFTNFKYVRKIWKDNCDEERLLGVSLTGILDNPGLMLDPSLLTFLKETAVKTNKEWAEKLGIPQSTAVTCVKPSGTVSQLVDSSSGLHARHSQYYLRTVRGDNKDPLTTFLKSSGIYYEPCEMKPDNTTIFYFPKKSPEGSITRDKLSALGSLEIWDMLQEYWCEHKPSATIYVREHEWMDTGAWVYENMNKLSGVSFLPYDGGSYKQAPYQELTQEEYEKWVREHPTPEIDWADLSLFEKNDSTTGSQEFACTGSSCEIVSIGEVDD